MQLESGVREQARQIVANNEQRRVQLGWDHGGKPEGAAIKLKGDTDKIAVRNVLEHEIPRGMHAMQDTSGSEIQAHHDSNFVDANISAYARLNRYFDDARKKLSSPNAQSIR